MAPGTLPSPRGQGLLAVVHGGAVTPHRGEHLRVRCGSLERDAAAAGDAAHRPLGRVRVDAIGPLGPGDQPIDEVLRQGVRHRGTSVGHHDHERREVSGRDELVGGRGDAHVAPLGLVGTGPVEEVDDRVAPGRIGVVARGEVHLGLLMAARSERRRRGHDGARPRARDGHRCRWPTRGAPAELACSDEQLASSALVAASTTTDPITRPPC